MLCGYLCGGKSPALNQHPCGLQVMVWRLKVKFVVCEHNVQRGQLRLPVSTDLCSSAVHTEIFSTSAFKLLPLFECDAVQPGAMMDSHVAERRVKYSQSKVLECRVHTEPPWLCCDESEGCRASRHSSSWWQFFYKATAPHAPPHMSRSPYCR